MSSTTEQPIIAIVGRPNVGKSTFFNRLVGRRKALVQDRAGVTRDRIYEEAEYLNRRFMLVDTGGFEPHVPEGHIYKHVRDQALLAIDEADIILFFVDGREGLNPSDKEVAHLLRSGTKKPIFLIVNKLDTLELQSQAYEFYALGFERLFPMSSETGLGGDELLDALLEFLPEPPPVQKKVDLYSTEGEDDEDAFSAGKIALIGRPNVGKSSLGNRLLGEDRLVVHNEAGTTRDSIDLSFVWNDIPFELMDTAGIRRRAKISDKLEMFTVVKAFKAIQQADICLLMIDPEELVTGQEQRLAGMVEEKGKAIVILVNKWDLFKGQGIDRKEIELIIREKMPYVKYAPILFISAKTGLGVHKLMPLVQEVLAQYRRKLKTPELNAWLKHTTEAVVPPMFRGRPVSFQYATQVRVQPPTFLLFLNQPEGVKPAYRRYLHNRLRGAFSFQGTPLRILLRGRN